MNYDRAAVRAVLDQVRTEGRTALTAPEGKQVCEAYGIPVPNEGLATSVQDAVRLAQEIGYPVVLKIVSTDILQRLTLVVSSRVWGVRLRSNRVIARSSLMPERIKPRHASLVCRCSRCCQRPRRSSLA